MRTCCGGAGELQGALAFSKNVSNIVIFFSFFYCSLLQRIPSHPGHSYNWTCLDISLLTTNGITTQNKRSLLD